MVIILPVVYSYITLDWREMFYSDQTEELAGSLSEIKVKIDLRYFKPTLF